MAKNLKIIVSEAKSNQWRFAIVSTKNGKTVLPSENYKRRGGMWKTIRALQKNGLDIPVTDEQGNTVKE